MLKLSNDCNINVRMLTGTSILFFGEYLTHRQACCMEKVDAEDIFINFSSYGNKIIFRHIIRKSFDRVKI